MEGWRAVSPQGAQQPLLLVRLQPADISQQLDGNGYEQFANVDWVCKTPYSQASQLNYDSKEHIGGSLRYGYAEQRSRRAERGFRAEHTNQIYTMLQHFRNMGRWASRATGTICRRLQ